MVEHSAGGPTLYLLVESHPTEAGLFVCASHKETQPQQTTEDLQRGMK